MKGNQNKRKQKKLCVNKETKWRIERKMTSEKCDENNTEIIW